MRKPPATLQSVLAQVLGTVAQTTGSGSPLLPIWESVVGPLTARHARAVSLRNGELVVQVDAAAWRDELIRHKAEVTAKLSAALGGTVIRRLRIEVG